MHERLRAQRHDGAARRQPARRPARCKPHPEEAALDKYVFQRDGYMQRAELIYDGNPPREPRLFGSEGEPRAQARCAGGEAPLRARRTRAAAGRAGARRRSAAARTARLAAATRGG